MHLRGRRFFAFGRGGGSVSVFFFYCGLFCKVVVEVQRSFILFIYIGVPHVKNLEILFCFRILSTFYMNSLLFFFVLLLFLLPCAMEIKELHA